MVNSNWTEVADLPGSLARVAEAEGHESVLGEPGGGKRMWRVNVEMSRTVTTDIEMLVLAASEDDAREMAREEEYALDPDSVDYLLDDEAEWDAIGVNWVEAVEIEEAPHAE